MNHAFVRSLLLWMLVFMGALLVLDVLTFDRFRVLDLPYSQFYTYVQEGRVASVVFEENLVKGELREPVKTPRGTYEKFRTVLPMAIPDLVDTLMSRGVVIKAQERSVWWQLFVNWTPWLIFLIFFWFIFVRQIQSGPRDALRFGQSRARIYVENRPSVTFHDVANAEEAKEELQEVIEFLSNPDKYRRIGARIPKGVLLVGPPGTGKTLMAKAVAGEAGVAFLSISGSEFVELFVGVGAARVRDLFDQARKHAPAIIFIDELDAVGRLRGAGLGGGHDEREQTLNQLLVEMDGFDSSEGIIVLAATNRPDVLDPALLRPGRFDRMVVVDRPDVTGRLKILKIHARKVALAPDVDLEAVARATPGFSGADLANLINEAAIIAARKGKPQIHQEDLLEAKDKVSLGKARRSMALSEEEKKRVAYHEAGHAVVSRFVPHADPIEKVSIIPRGMALGITQSLPEEDRHIHTLSYLMDTMAVMLGGYSAERIVFGEVSTGAQNDIERVTELARRMVTTWGMSPKLGPVAFGREEGEIFLGRELGVRKTFSEKVAEIIDSEVHRFVKEALERAENILHKHLEGLHALAQALLERETVMGSEVDQILRIPSAESA